MKKFIIVITALLFNFMSFSELFADGWTQKADFGGSARYWSVGFSIGGKGYIGTGYDGSIYYKDFWAYDPSTDTWTQKADFNGPARYMAVGFSIGGKGFLGTGSNGSTYYKDFWEYDPELDTWTQKADFSGPERHLAVGFSIGGEGYIGTGADSSTYYKDFWEYDPELNIWTQKADFGGSARNAAVGFSIGGKGYLGMGVDGSTYYKDFWEYDSSANTWTQKADFGGTNGFTGFSFGGKGYLGLGSDIDFWEYDPASNMWTQKTSFGGVKRGGAVGFAIGDKGYIGMGTESSNTYKDFWEYDTALDTTADQFIFIDQTNVKMDEDIISNTITVSGIQTPIAISVTGGTYSINGGAYTSESGMVSNDDTVTVKVKSSALTHTKTEATLVIGTITDTFSVTTQYIPDVGDSDPCFIATAAFGSPLARQVEILRKLRDEYLLTNDFGRTFVAWYYRHGPVAAKFIKDKPVAKAAVRAALYPLIVFSFLMISGYLPMVMFGLMLIVVILRRKPQQTPGYYS